MEEKAGCSLAAPPFTLSSLIAYDPAVCVCLRWLECRRQIKSTLSVNEYEESSSTQQQSILPLSSSLSPSLSIFSFPLLSLSLSKVTDRLSTSSILKPTRLQVSGKVKKGKEKTTKKFKPNLLYHCELIHIPSCHFNPSLSEKKTQIKTNGLSALTDASHSHKNQWCSQLTMTDASAHVVYSWCHYRINNTSYSHIAFFLCTHLVSNQKWMIRKDGSANVQIDQFSMW